MASASSSNNWGSASSSSNAANNSGGGGWAFGWWRGGEASDSRNSSQTVDLAASSTDSGSKLPVESSDPASVWLHVYDIDPYTGWMNRAFLKDVHLGLFHCGVEAWSSEWSFQYFEDAWDDKYISGVLECVPRHMDGYIYKESIYMGRTSLSPEEVEDVVEELQEQWPASSYHITKRNCITFSEELISKLKVERPFPEWISGLPKTGLRWRPVSAVVDYGWDIAKWYMIRKHEVPQQQLRLQKLDQEIHETIIRIDRLTQASKEPDLAGSELVLQQRIQKAEQELSDLRDERARLQYEASTSSVSMWSIWRCGGPADSNITVAKPGQAI